MNGVFILLLLYILLARQVYDMNDKIRKQSFQLRNPPVITHWASIAGKKEGAGPLSNYYDAVIEDTYFGEKTWEQAEKKFQQAAIETIQAKSNISKENIQLILSGDLLNQCIGSAQSINNLKIPHLGLYGACSTMAESLVIASMCVGGGFFDNAIALTSSHFASSERQYRFPLGYGGQRPPTSQWTVTGAGAALVQSKGNGPRITSCTVGSVVDMGIKDANNMGAAMAPAALSTISAHLRDTARTTEDYDLIITGDLGQLGKEILMKLAEKDGFNLAGKLADCGCLVFDNTAQDVHSGGSGCGCSAIALCGYILDQIKLKKMSRILFCGTGALLSPTSIQQGLSIPAVCHAVCIESEEN